MFKGKTILVVDDNLVNRKMLSAMMTKDGYSVLQAANGQEALDFLTGNVHQVDLILLDIVMPIMDGHQLLAKMQETGLISQVPVIVLTGSEHAATEIACLQEGASDFLKKPYNAELVRHRVESILRLWDNALWVSKLETDRITGVYNTESFLRHATEMRNQKPDAVWNLVYVTIEDFNLIKGRYGNENSEIVLKYTADCIKKWAGDTGLFGKLGTEEFVILDGALADLEQDEIRSIWSDAFKGCPVHSVSVKSGVCRITDPKLSTLEYCERAKMAEASIRHQYGVYTTVYDDTIRQASLREHQLTSYMEEALEKRQFVVYLQPKHDTATGEVAGAEALVRWIHPELGFISPGEFIPLFERNGFIARVDYFVWQEACRILRTWLDSGVKPVPISVNASRVDFQVNDLPKMISDLIDAYDLTPDLLHVEVTESAYTDQPQELIKSVSILQQLGFKIEMDDFGSGYSSLNMLSELPIDILKLDMRFMQQSNDKFKNGKRNILSFIVGLSKWLQLPTVAEGVETQEEFDQMRALGCNMIQGYFFSKPMPIDDFAQYMHDYVNKVTVEKKAPVPTDWVGPLPGAKRQILIVEDIESNREIMKALLGDAYDIVTAENGQVAYDYLKSHYSKVSCILLDLLMPVMDGFTLLEKIHADVLMSKIPVIITTETGNDGELRALNLGAVSYVAKPYNPDVLRHHIRRAIEESEMLTQKDAYVDKIARLEAELKKK